MSTRKGLRSLTDLLDAYGFAYEQPRGVKLKATAPDGEVLWFSPRAFSDSKGREAKNQLANLHRWARKNGLSEHEIEADGPTAQVDVHKAVSEALTALDGRSVDELTLSEQLGMDRNQVGNALVDMAAAGKATVVEPHAGTNTRLRYRINKAKEEPMTTAVATELSPLAQIALEAMVEAVRAEVVSDDDEVLDQLQAENTRLVEKISDLEREITRLRKIEARWKIIVGAATEED